VAHHSHLAYVAWPIARVPHDRCVVPGAALVGVARALDLVRRSYEQQQQGRCQHERPQARPSAHAAAYSRAA
jgi:hypothetical protein